MGEKKYTVADFINHGTNNFIDISSEIRRIYTFGRQGEVIIEHPLLLCVKDNGHRVWDANGVSHYIPSGWIHLMWVVEEGKPNFVK